MSNSRIFSVPNKAETQGRSANLAGTMFKRSPIFSHVPVQKPEVSPFANYNCKSSESLFNESQQSLNDTRISADNVRQIVKEEMNKNQSDYNSKKQIQILQAQINDMRDRFGQIQKSTLQKMQQFSLNIKQEMKAEAQKTGKQVQVEISSKLRIFFQKANIELKKDILKSIEDEGKYLNQEYGEQILNRFDSVEEQIDAIKLYIQGNNNQPTSGNQNNQSSVMQAQNLQAKINKLQREIQNNKKISNELSSRLKNTEQYIEEERSRQIQKEFNQQFEVIKQKIKTTENQQNALMKRIGSLEFKQSSIDQKYKQTNQKLNQLQKCNCEYSLTFSDVEKKLSQQQARNKQKFDDLKKFIRNSQNMDISINSSSLEQQVKHKPSLKPNTLNVQNSIMHDTSLTVSVDLQQQSKTIYQFDNEGNLMDGQGKYILNSSNQLIKLTNDQINELINSKGVSIVES